jgi:hypothetical protein
MGAQICVERELGGIVVVTPVAVEVWMSSWWNDRGHIGLGRGFRAPVDCARSRPSHRQGRVPWLGGSRGSPSCQRVPRVPRRDGKMSPEASISPETSPQGSGGMEFVVRAASD